MKICNDCKIGKALEEFSKRNASADGLQQKCKACVAAYSAKNKERRLVQARARYAADPEKERKRSRLYKAANAERVIEYGRAHYAENAEKMRERCRIYREKNPEKVVETRKKYVSANLDKYAAKARNRRAMLRSAEGKHTAADVRRIFEHQRGLCANCKIKIAKSGSHKLHVDHIVPLALGGSNWPSNLQCLCQSCNVRKLAKDPFEWAKEQGRLL